MAEWALAHPWLTFWLLIFALIVVSDAISDIVRARKPKPPVSRQESDQGERG